MATVGRRKRKRRPGAGSAAKVRPHTRDPRGSNLGKTRVKVDSYKRGLPSRQRPRRTRNS